MTLAQIIRRNPSLRAALAVPLAMRRQWLQRQAKPISTLLSRFEDVVTSDVRIRVDEFKGEFVIGPRSHLLRRFLANGKYEPELAQLFRSCIAPDRDVIDVGANIGFYSVLAAKHLDKGRVLAAEPTKAAHARLLQNLALNGVADKVIVFNGLISSKDATTDIKIVEGREEYSSIGAMAHPSIAGQPIVTETIRSRPLDALVKDHQLDPAVIKVDVEGAEMMVFEGAEETLKRHRPIVISEFSRPLLLRNGTSPEAIVSFFDRCGYDVRDPFDPKMQPGSVDFGDIVATPR